MFLHRHSTNFSIVFTLITMMGKVRKTNQREIKKDCFSFNCFIPDILQLLRPFPAQNPRGLHDKNNNEKGKGKDILIIARYITGGKTFCPPQDQSSQYGAGNTADPP